jgi:transcriptional regulator with XRE-family HTH domain
VRDSEAVEEARRALGRQLAVYRRAAGRSQAELAAELYCSRSTIANVETGRQNVDRDFWLRAGSALMAAGALAEASDKVAAAVRREREQAARQLSTAGLDGMGLADEAANGTGTGQQSGDDIPAVMAWAAETNASDEFVEQMARACAYLAEAHPRTPPTNVLPEVLRVHRRVHACLRGGRQRLRQTRELLRIESDLLAHACVLLGDLGHDRRAATYGGAALVFAREAGADEAISWSVQAKTARWQQRYVESAELARRGLEVSTLSPARIELAYGEANAIALFGDAVRARQALQQAEQIAETMPANAGALSVWSFPVERQALFALSVAIHIGDPDAALRAAAAADAGWAAGDPKNPATWAQVRAGSAIAYLMKDSLDGAVQQVAPVLDLPAGLRITTVTGYLTTLQRMLAHYRFAKNAGSIQLRERIRVFNSAAPSPERRGA